MTADRTSDGLDPEIRAFVRRMGELWREHPPLAGRPVVEQRQIGEKVRSSWAEGGPVMARTSEQFVPSSSGSVRIRVLDPGGAAPKPALIYLHGGGWTLFSIDTHDRIMREYASRAGITVTAVDYSLSPEAKFPQPIEETMAVVRWLRTAGASIGVDGGRLAIGGDSAGAALTISTCLMLRAAGELAGIKGMLLNYGAFDTSCDSEAFRRFGHGGYLWEPGEMPLYWANYLRSDADASDPLAVPMRADVTGLPPAFLATPECDVLYDAGIAMGEKLRRSGVLAQTVVYPGATHSFLEAVSIARIADRAFADASRWLSDALAV